MHSSYLTSLWPHVWAGGYKTLLQPLLLLQKKVVRIIARTHYLAHTASLSKDCSLLTITDLYKLQLTIFMYRYHKGTLPKIYDHYFSLNASLHDHNTRTKFNLHSILSRTNVSLFDQQDPKSGMLLIQDYAISVHSMLSKMNINFI